MPAPGEFLGTDISSVSGRAVATVQMLGLEQVMAAMASLPRVSKLALGHAMRAEMEGVIELAKDQYVPRDTGQLADSGKTRGPIFPDSSSVEVWGSFGPAENPRGSDYTIPVHEIPEPPAKSVGGHSAHHEWGTWKYLQIPFLVRQDGMADRIGAEFFLLIDRLGLSVTS